MDMRRDIRIDIGLQRHFRSFDDGFEEWIVVFGEDKRETHFKTGYADIVFEHAAFYQVLAGAGIAHMAQSIYDLLARNMQVYCSITHIDKDEIRAVLVFHQSRMDFIHMLELTIPTQLLFNEGSTFTGELFTNIPQNNIYSLFREKGKSK